MRISRRGASIAVRLTCPKRASSACKVGVALTRPAKRGKSRVVTIVSRRVTVAAGKTAKLTLRKAQIKLARKSLRLQVTTTTSAGKRAARYAIPR